MFSPQALPGDIEPHLRSKAKAVLLSKV